MYFRWTLFKLHGKRYIRLVPTILLETLLFALIVLGIGAYASKALYGEKTIGEIRVGVVASENEMTELLLSFVESMDSMKDTVSFTLLSGEQARSQLKGGDIYAAVILPDGLVEGILSGENIPARILLGNSRGRVETEVFVQLAGAGARLLTTAQAGIYAADRLCREMERLDLIGQSEDDLNQAYLNYALGRSSLLREREVDALNGGSLTDYYGVSLFLAFLTFVGTGFGKAMQVRVSERERIFQARGVGAIGRYLADVTAFAGVFAFIGSLMGVPVFLWLSGKAGSTFHVSFCWLWMVVICAGAGIFLRMLFQITGNGTGGIAAVFLFLLICMLASGIVIPPAFLPVWAEQFGKHLPYKGWMDELTAALQGRMTGRLMWQTMARMGAFLVPGALAAVIRQQAGNRRKGAAER